MYEGPGQKKVHMLIIGDTERKRVKFAHAHSSHAYTYTHIHTYKHTNKTRINGNTTHMLRVHGS